MSARAAWRLEEIGFTDVYDYEVGRKDWEAAALPIEGSDARGPIVADATQVDPPSARRGELVAAARQRLGSGSQVIVVNDTGVVIGVMRKESWDASDDSLVEDAMRLGPATVRPGAQLGPLLERMEARDIESVIVADPEGRLIGVVDVGAAKETATGELDSRFETCDACPGWWRHRLKNLK